MTTASRLAVGVIGAGRVGPVLAAALAGVGHRLVGITHGSDPDRVEAVLPGVPVRDPEELLADADLVVVAVPRAQLAGLVAGLADVGAWRAGQLVLHTDPGLGVDVLGPAARAGAIPLAVHPAIAFTGTTMDLRQLEGSFAAVTAPAPVLPIAQALAVELGCEPVVVAEEDRAAYGEGIETATAFSASIVRQSAELLRAAGVEAPGAYLQTLVHASVDRALSGLDPLEPPRA